MAPSESISKSDEAAAVPEAPGPELSRLRFIPFRRSDLPRMLVEEDLLDASGRARFDAATDLIERHFSREFHGLRQSLKNSYAGLDPNADTRYLGDSRGPVTTQSQVLADELATLLDRANYEKLTDADLKRAFRNASLFQIRLQVNMAEFEDVLLYCRGASERSETIRHFFGLYSRTLRFVNYERVVLYLRFADVGQGADSDFPPGRVMIKLFQNVPDADLEMLFPNTRVGMRWIDRLLIGVPAVASGAVVALTKLGAPLLLLGGLLGYWMGLRSEPVELDQRGLALIGAGFGALGAYIWKQWSSYRNRKARFRQVLTRNLYFKLLDNNGGVLLRILDDAEDSECKEAFAAMYFLLAEGAPLTARGLDARIEAWFAERWDAWLDFDVEDALGKLQRLGLAEDSNGHWVARGPVTADTDV